MTFRPEDLDAGSLLWRLSSRLPAGTTQVRIVLEPLDQAGTAGLGRKPGPPPRPVARMLS